MITHPRVFYIDPQSYKNLSVYDYELLSHIDGAEVVYYHNRRYQLPSYPCEEHYGVFTYSDRRGLMKAMSYAMSLCRIALAVVRRKPHVVHIQWFRAFLVDSLFVLFLRLLGVRIVFTAHNVVPHNATSLDRWAYRWYYRHVDTIIVHTTRTKEELAERYAVGEKTVVIPHGVLPAVVSAEAVRRRSDELRETLHTDGKLVFASMGYQNYYKGIDLISEVWCGNEWLCRNPQVQLLIVGKVQHADLHLLAQCENVTIVDDVVPDIDFEAYLSLTNVALLPYRTISQSGVLLTCLQRGIPVVVTDVGGLTDPLAYGNVGWCIGDPTADNLAATLQPLVATPEQIAAVRDNRPAFDHIRHVYSWTTIAATTAQLYST